MNWRKTFFDNYKAKLALFLMAAFLWFFVVSSREYLQAVRIPVSTISMPSNRVLLSDLPPWAEVRFRGKGTSLLLLGLFGNPHLNVDLSSSSYNYILSPSVDQVEWNPAIEVQVVDVLWPDTIQIQIDDLIKRRLKVRPELIVKPAPDFAQVTPLQVTPDSVTVFGARSTVQRLNYALTHDKVIEDVTDGLSIELPLIAPPGSKIDFDPVTVNVRVLIEKVIEKQFSSIPIEVTGLPRGMEAVATPDHASIRLRGAISRLDSLMREDVTITVNAALQEVRGYPLKVALPDCVNLAEINPAYVTLVLSKL
jgi:hypothetical protein